MRYRINEPWVPSCMQKAEPEGPLVPYLRPFAQSLIEQGYFGNYLRRHVMLAMYFSQWLKRRDIRACCITSEHSLSYLKYRHRRGQSKPEDSAAVSHLMVFLRSARVIPVDVTSISSLLPVERVIRAHGQYLRKERALTSGTIYNYGYFVRDFLNELFGTSAVKLSCLNAADIIRYVQRRASRLRAKQAKSMTTALRSFLRYARWRGAVKMDLAAAVPSVPVWSMASIPRDIPAEQTQELLASIDRNTALGRRNYAILLLLARLGLRSGAVKSMELDDIDWRTGQLMVRGKAGRHHEMPLPADVGHAIAAYLQHGRPNSCSRRLFLRSRAPYRGFARNVGTIARSTLQRAMIKAPTYGTHQFRHGLASQMLRQGASLTEIGAVLGHQHPDTTRIYTKIDLKALHTLAQPWPGGVG
jgi:integrase/recombinase XerD